MDTLIIRLLDEPGGGYRVQLLVDSGSGTSEPELVAHEPLPEDLDPAGAPEILDAGPLDVSVLAHVAGTDRSEEFTRIGEWLAGLVFRGEVATTWDARVAAGAASRTLLEVRPAALAKLPWELMRRGASRLFLSAAHPFARAVSLEADQSQELVPLRLLVVQGSREDTLGIASEVGGITMTLPEFGGRVETMWLTEPSREELWGELGRFRPHVLHFAGHGFRDPDTQLPALKVGSWALTSDDILDAMPWWPRVAILNACRTNEGDVEQVQALSSAFLARKTAAVIAMQGDIRGQAAARFGITLYQALAQGELIDKAAAMARQAVYGAIGAPGKARDWFLPSLTLRVRPEAVLPLTCGCSLSDDDVDRIGAELFEPTKLFVGRVDERWKLVQAVDPDDGEPRRLMVVEGAMDLGKTWLARWVRTRCALRGRRVRYVDFDGLDSIGWLQSLEVIRSTADDVPSLAPTPGAYDRYLHDLGYLLTGRLPPEPEPGEPIIAPVIDGKLQLGPDDVGRIFQAFRAALERDAREEPLLLIFDHLDGMFRDDFRTRLYPLLIKNIADGDVPNVRALVVLSPEQRRSYWPDERAVWSEVPVDLIDRDQFQPLAREIVYLMGTDVGEIHLTLINALNAGISGPWGPKSFRPLIDAVASWRS